MYMYIHTYIHVYSLYTLVERPVGARRYADPHIDIDMQVIDMGEFCQYLCGDLTGSMWGSDMSISMWGSDMSISMWGSDMQVIDMGEFLNRRVNVGGSAYLHIL